MRKSGIGFAADMNMRDTAVPKVGAILVVLLGTGMLLLNGIGTRLPVVPVVAADQGVGREAGAHDTESQALNPHSDFIFRATGATSCRDCHRIGKSGSLSPQSIDNDLVRNLREKANGIHGPGRFADCLRCHAGGSKGVEKY
jgi:hypothetical protein